jgi:hypothetical protein
VVWEGPEKPRPLPDFECAVHRCAYANDQHDDQRITNGPLQLGLCSKFIPYIPAFIVGTAAMPSHAEIFHGRGPDVARGPKKGLGISVAVKGTTPPGGIAPRIVAND